MHWKYAAGQGGQLVILLRKPSQVVLTGDSSVCQDRRFHHHHLIKPTGLHAERRREYPPGAGQLTYRQLTP